MKKSLFAKYFTVCSVIILTSFVALGTIFTVFISSYIRNERQQSLSKNVDKAVNFTIYNYEASGGTYLDKRVLTQFYSSMADDINGFMFLTEENGKTLICTEEGICNHKVKDIPASVLQQVKNQKEYREYGKLGGIYSTMHYTVARTIHFDDMSVEPGYLFISTPAVHVSSLVSDIFKMFLIACVVSLVISCVLIYIITSILSRPLKQMSIAAKSFGRGDFSTRITYRSEDEIGELAVSFNQMADSLSELETMRKNFIANVSHELKTPMTTIGGFIDGILDGTISKDEQSHYLTLVSDEVKRLSRLVKSMLSIAKIESGDTKINFATFDISDTIISTLFLFEKKIEEKNLDVIGLVDMQKTIVYGDSDLIHQVVYNLIDNAVKFCNNNGYLEFKIEHSQNEALVYVRNSGAGLSKEEVTHVFDRFYKTDKSRGLDKNGVGLGLHIVKSILDMNGGKITVGSIQGQYTEFIISLPLVRDNDEKPVHRERKFFKK